MNKRDPGAADNQPVPKARVDRLLVQEVMDEILVYDLNRHRSHCLNRTAALVWRQCDGSASAAEIASRLQHDMPIEEEAVWLALDRLGKAHLLEERMSHRAGQDRATRRAVLRRLAAVGAVALVSSIAAPAAMAAGSAPPLCLTNCCARCKSGTGNNCKCCFDDTTGGAVCVNDCGANTCSSGNQGTPGSCGKNSGFSQSDTCTCFQLPNCCNPGQPPC